jgi:superfamily II DNA/RNA helicase
MSLTKLRPILQEILPDKGISTLNPLQLKILEGLKAGKNLLVEAPDGSGKTTSLLLSVLQKIEAAGEGSPRAIIVCSTDQKAYDLHEQLTPICRILDLTVDLAHERGNMLLQRNAIFDGTEIIVAHPKRLYDLYIQNGFNVGQMKLFILDDALELIKNGYKMQLSRIVESLPKCQHIYCSTSFNDRKMEEYLEEFLPVSTTIHATSLGN